MRLWTLHPRYLDRQGLTAAWREGLLAQKVLQGGTRGYRNHPQLQRFRAAPDPAVAIGAYLLEVAQEATERGYRFDRSRIVCIAPCAPLPASAGQLDYEWRHLLAKLACRSPQVHARWSQVQTPQPHPLFRIEPGPVAQWERVEDPQ